ncbi:hypothetical protein EV421DRAFT_760675 [Armillaria borealis]|uniref:Uncharacterized protein n=1 Tax=Armillaria borealis TaxID=47425 RepID=A0AA39MNS0_9AGAR|nr:hypothetical protein EV421DRAFT_760675 [Armillaria borealis]
MIAIAFAANGVKVYITRRRLDVLAKAAASVTGVPGTQMDVRRRKHQAGAKHIEEIDRKFDILVNKFVCRALRSSRPYTDAFRVPDLLVLPYRPHHKTYARRRSL